MNLGERNRLLDGMMYGLVLATILWGIIIFIWFMLTT